MHFDDRLATVLRHRAASDRGMHTQYRQLLDLLGAPVTLGSAAQRAAAVARLEHLDAALPATDRGALIEETGGRLRNPALVALLAAAGPVVAAAAMRAAQLDVAEWGRLIPRLPVRARGFLRFRSDLDPATNELLARLGVRDFALPEPDRPDIPADAVVAAPHAAPRLTGPTAPSPPPGPDIATQNGIGAIVRRIEAYRQARADRDVQGQVPDPQLGATRHEAVMFDFSSDGAGRIVWADPAVAAMIVGLRLNAQGVQACARPDAATGHALRRHQPVIGGRIELDGAPAIAGAWQIDAVPRFDAARGSFMGHDGRLRRLADAPPAPAPIRESAADRMRQQLHELRTPVNAIQGFAEIIQQQLFAPVPHEYRALSATIASDAAQVMAGLEEVDRLARLEMGASRLSAGETDLADVLQAMTGDLSEYLHPRASALALRIVDGTFVVALDTGEVTRMLWRVLATLAGATKPGEILKLRLRPLPGSRLRLSLRLPELLCQTDDVFAATSAASASAINAGLFGVGFTLRLARAEAVAASGALEQDGNRLRLFLPLLTRTGQHHSAEHNAAPEADRINA